MIGLKETAIAVGFFTLGLTAAQMTKQAQAHGSALTRLDMQQALREALRNQPKQPLSAAELRQAIKQGINGCRFKGQNSAKETTETADSVDFQGQLAC
jgi:hypothetical protein